MTSFAIESFAPMELVRPSSLAEMYTLSPFVWREAERYALLLRLVNQAEHAADKVSRIHSGTSLDGLRFHIGDSPVIAPGPDLEDKDGCEDPTLTVVAGQTYVYYSGWNQTTQQGQLLLAAGKDAEHLRKRGIAIPSSGAVMNPKESSIVPLADGTWRLFFEYADEGASKVGIASAPAVDGPWTIHASPFVARPDSWDSWHLSPGPVLFTDSTRPVMFYNGATKEVQWRIGWIAFDADCTRVVERCEEPLIVPPSPGPGDTDIAFAASAIVEGETVYLYYSTADKDLWRAALRRSG